MNKNYESIKSYFYVIDPSFLLILFEKKINIEAIRDLKIFIPNKLNELILKAEKETQYREFLWKFLNYFSYSRGKNKSIYNLDKQKIFFENYELLNQKIKKINIDEDVDKKIYEFCLKTFEKNDFVISMSPQINLLAEVLGEIMGFSKQKNAYIIMKTRRFVNLFREKLAVLELPKKLNSLRCFIKNCLRLISKDFVKDNIKHIIGHILSMLVPATPFMKWFIGKAIECGHYKYPKNIILTFMDP
ncbi:MAG: hypothetical protein ACYCS0_08325 [bacterium]